MIYISIILFISFLYLKIFLRYKILWDKISVARSDNQHNFISIIIACRNEENNIEDIISDVFSQNFDNDRFELIIVDDHSEDNTIKILNSQKKKYDNLRVFLLDESLSGKINAINKGVLESKGEIIFCTDADCKLGPNWIRTIKKYFSNSHTMLVLAPIKNIDDDRLLFKFQSLEVTSLVAASASSISCFDPIFCNGANLAFRKSVYKKITQEETDSFITDDVSLLFYIHKKYHRAITFVKERDAIIKTKQPSSIRSYIEQRLRWINGFRNESSFTSRYLATVVFLMNFLLCLTFIFCVIDFIILDSFDFKIYISFYILLFVKFFTDFIFLYRPLIFFDNRKLLLYVFPFQIVYAFYILVIVTLSFIVPRHFWKDRVVKNKI